MKGDLIDAVNNSNHQFDFALDLVRQSEAPKRENDPDQETGQSLKTALEVYVNGQN